MLSEVAIEKMRMYNKRRQPSSKTFVYNSKPHFDDQSRKIDTRSTISEEDGFGDFLSKVDNSVLAVIKALRDEGLQVDSWYNANAPIAQALLTKPNALSIFQAHNEFLSEQYLRRCTRDDVNPL